MTAAHDDDRPLFMSLRGREGCIVHRPGDEEPGWWLLLREGELRGLLRAYDDVRERLGRAEGLLRRLAQWDALNGTTAPYGDGPYWKREIDAVLNQAITEPWPL